MLIPSREAEDLYAGWWRLLSQQLLGVPKTLVWDGEGAVGRWRARQPELTVPDFSTSASHTANTATFSPVAGMLALLFGCVENDTGDAVSAEATRQFAHDLGAEIDNRQLMGWAHEMTAWFALTSGDYHRVIAASEHGMSIAGQRDVGVQLAAQSAKAWARLNNRRKVEVALDRGQSLLETLPRPSNPDDPFQIDPAKWHFYAMDAYRHVGENSLAQTYAEEVLRLGTSVNGEERSPMRLAEARITLGVLAARAGDLDAATDQGHAALHGPRSSIPTLIMISKELATEVVRVAGKTDPRVRDYLDDVRTTALSAQSTRP